MKKNKLLKKMRKANNNGAITSYTLYGAVALLAGIGFVLSSKDSNGRMIKNEVAVEDTLQKMNIPEEISLKDTEDYKVIKVQSSGQERSGDTWIREYTKYYIVKEFYFPYAKKLDVTNLYALVDIESNETVLYRDENGKMIDENYELECVELGDLTSYLIKFDCIKEKYKTNELGKIITEKLEQDNQNHDKFDFSDTTSYKILELENKKNNTFSYHIAREWPNPSSICHKVSSNPDYYATDILYNSIYEDIMKNKCILEVDEEDEVVEEYKDYSYHILGSLADFLVEYNIIQPEYTKEEFQTVIDRIEKKYKPVQKTK